MEQKKKILIIEDEPEIIKGTPELLKEAGYLVWMANNAQEAMEKLEAFNPDLILMDLVLPDQSGFRIAQKIKSLSKYRHIPIIAVSLKTEPIDKHIALKSGIVEYIEKPVDNGRLLYHIRDILKAETI
jgi:two-component system alkaline phosphatase synthesis response regulator PhoP/two-component system response regulator VicR